MSQIEFSFDKEVKDNDILMTDVIVHYRESKRPGFRKITVENVVLCKGNYDSNVFRIKRKLLIKNIIIVKFEVKVKTIS